MCIYIISDDMFFVSGLKYVLSANDTEIKEFRYADGLTFLYCGKFRQDDIVIIDVNYTNTTPTPRIAQPTDYFGVNLVFVVDLPLLGEYSGFHPYWLVSKKCPFKKILPLLKQLTNHAHEQTDHLSKKENIVLRELAGGRSTHFISRKLNLSVKTISSHKQNAFRKLGMARMNDMSLLCYRQIITLYAEFNRSSVKQAGGAR